MKNIVADTNEKQIISLFEYIEKSSTDDELFSARQECAMARHSLKAVMLAYEGMLNFIRNHPDKVTEEVTDMLLNASDKMRKDAGETVTILKKAAEIDVLRSSKFDALQVIALIEQLPSIIAQELETALETIFTDVISEIHATIEDKEQKEKLLKHEFLNTARKLAIARAVKHISELMSEKIRNTTVVPGVNTDENNNLAHQKGITQEEINAMMGTLPIDNRRNIANNA